MVADIVGSSLILQQDRYLGFDLYGTFQSIMLPLIKSGGGFDIEFTGDDVSAKFRDSHSAVNTGRTIHKTLASWNSINQGPALAVRIGIHAVSKSSETHHRNLPLIIASRLQSLGRADAICVTAPVIENISPLSTLHVQCLGDHSLGHTFISPVFYLFDEKPKFLTTQRVLFERLRYQYSDTKNIAMASPVILFFIFVSAIFVMASAENRMQNIEIADITNFNAKDHVNELSSISTLLRTSIDAVAGFNVVSGSKKLTADIQLVCSFQQLAGKVRLTWAIYEQADRVQLMGGDITGKTENLPSLQRQFAQSIVVRLKES